ncbi:MAG: hypothetical protein ACLSSW_06005 [Acutalibacteraceae bacterium]
MNYLAEILAFNNWIRYNSAITKSDICLWHSLMSMANRFAWKEFTSPILTLLSESKLTKNEFYKSRNKLKQFGLIDFKERGGNKATVYKVNSVVSLYEKQNQTQIMTQSDTQIDTQTVTQNVNINKTKNQKPKTRNKKEINKESFGEFENVRLSEQELSKLKTRFGEDANSYIERLSNYIASSGKRYKSHYATILTWAENDKQSEKLGGGNYADKSQRHPKQLCKEYPE